MSILVICVFILMNTNEVQKVIKHVNFGQSEARDLGKNQNFGFLWIPCVNISNMCFHTLEHK